MLRNPHIRAEILTNDLENIMQWANKWKIEFNERKTELMNITRNKNHQFQLLNFGWTILEDSHSLLLFFFFIFFFLSCPLYVFIHFSAAFCTAHCALDLAKDHAP